MIRRLLSRIGVDRAVSYGLAARVWTLLAGPVSVLLIATKFSREEQGYYYTFASILVLQTFLELGLGTVIIQFASHEWSHLSLAPGGGIEGSPPHLSRLASLARFSMRWYGLAAPLSVVTLAIAGYVFFSTSHVQADVSWTAPWMALCVVSGVNLALLPLWSVLEGCNQIQSVYLYRLSSAVVTSITTWAAVWSGAGLWSAALGLTAAVVLALVALYGWFREFFSSLFRVAVSHVIDWRRDILPLQWRIALSWLSGYFVYQFFTPLAFRLYGPAVAGQVGMTWGLVSAVLATAYTWMAVKTPTLGMLIARGERRVLDAVFFRALMLSFGAAMLGGAAVVAVTAWLYAMRFQLATRLLSPLPTAIFLCGTALAIVVWGLIAYGRAHKAETFLPVTVGGALVTPPLAILLGKPFGAVGLALSHCIVIALQLGVALPLFFHYRNRWNDAAPAQRPGTSDRPASDNGVGRVPVVFEGINP